MKDIRQRPSIPVRLILIDPLGEFFLCMLFAAMVASVVGIYFLLFEQESINERAGAKFLLVVVLVWLCALVSGLRVYRKHINK